MRRCNVCLAEYPNDHPRCAKDGAPTAPLSASGDKGDIGLTVGNYLLEAKLAEGGMGTIYRALHLDLGRRAAVKILRGDLSTRPDVVDRFLAEAKAATRISHENICEIFDVGALPDGRRYIVMEYLEGEDLFTRLLRERPLPVPEAASIAVEIAAALSAAHEAGVVHRDLKPENIFLSRKKRGGKSLRVVKLLDFGIAKLLYRPRRYKTQIGALLGTPTYMSPEQARGEEQIGPKTDIYALGVILYECLSGEPPFPQDFYPAVLKSHLEEEPAPPSAKNPRIPPELERLILDCLRKRPEERPASAAEVKRRLTPFLPAFTPDPDSSAAWVRTETGLFSAIPRPAAKRRAVPALLGAAVLLLAAVFYALLTGAEAPRSAAPLAAAVTAQMTPPAPLAVLESTPSGAEVFEGGALSGKTPLALPAGDAPRSLVLKHAGYREAKIMVAPGRGASVELQKQPPEPKKARPGSKRR